MRSNDRIREAVFSAKFFYAQEAVIVAAVSGKILQANQEALLLADLPRSQMQKLRLGDLFCDPRSADRLLQRLLKRSWIKNEEVIVKNGNGHPIPACISGNLVYPCSDQPTIIVVTIRPKHQPSEAEDMLKRERNFISAILETTGALVVLLDDQGRCIRINNSFEHLTGFTIIDLLGLNFWEQMLPDREISVFRNMFRKTCTADSPIKHRGVLITKDARQLQVIWTLTALKNGDHSIDYIICTGIDVTELQEAKAQIRTLNGLLPICSFCKKIRDDHGYWKILEEYIRDHSEASFSHSMCPECRKKHYPRYAKKGE